MDSYFQDNSGDMQYSASNPVPEFHFSALHHGDYVLVLWAQLWFVVCGCVLVRYRVPPKYSENCFHVGIIVVEI